MNTLLCVLVVCSVAVAASLITDECPPKESLGCYCTTSPLGPRIVCPTINSLEVLQRKLNSLKDYAVQELDLRYVSSALPADLFGGLHIKSLMLYDFVVSAESSFLPELGLESSLEKLDLLELTHRGHKSLTNFKLDHYPSLKEITIDDTLVSEVGNDWFANGPKSLITLWFSLNDMKKLGDQAFSSLSNLQSLTVKDNHLKEISRSVLPLPATHLEKLDFSYNEISSLPSDLFSEMPSLKYVDFSFNGIQTLPEDTWSPILSNLAEVYLGYSLKCDQDLKWICDEANLINVLAFCTDGKSIRKFCALS